MTQDEFNSWACDIANDYAQAVTEMGPEDHESWREYLERRMRNNPEAEAFVMNNASTPTKSTYVAPDVDDEPLPF